MPRYIVTLTNDEIQELKALIQKGGKGYRIKHAQILLKLDQKPENKAWTVDIFQNGYNKNCKSKQYHELFICTHRKRLLPFKARKRRYSHPIGSPGKHIMLSWFWSCDIVTGMI